MAVNERRLRSLYESARQPGTEEDAETLIQSLPHPAADLATKRDIAELRAEMLDRFRAQTMWFSGALVAGMSVAAAIGRFA